MCATLSGIFSKLIAVARQQAIAANHFLCSSRQDPIVMIRIVRVSSNGRKSFLRKRACLPLLKQDDPHCKPSFQIFQVIHFCHNLVLIILLSQYWSLEILTFLILSLILQNLENQLMVSTFNWSVNYLVRALFYWRNFKLNSRMIRYDLIWYALIRYDMIRSDMIWYDASIYLISIYISIYPSIYPSIYLSMSYVCLI